MTTPAVTESARAPARQRVTVERQKPLMTMRQILLMNFGFLGIQYSFGMQQTAINPIFEFLHANPRTLPLLNLAGPITGLFIQPLIGAWSDRTWSDRWGRRKPFFITGAVGCSVCLFLFPFVAAIWMAVLLLWLLDASNNTAMEPYRAFIADMLPPSLLGKGFLAQSFFAGFGVALADVSLFVFQKVITGGTHAGIPYWVLGSFMLGAVCSIGSMLVSVLRASELPPTKEQLNVMKAKRGGVGTAVRDVVAAIVEMPGELRKLSLVYLFQWYAAHVYFQFVALSVSKSVYGTTNPRSAHYAKAVALTGLINGWYNIVTFSVAFLLIAFARRRGAKWVHTTCLLCAAVGLTIFPHVHNKYALFVPIIGLGIAWASMVGVPYILIMRLIPSGRYGVYMGIVNMMIVIPQLIQTLSFGQIYTHVLGDNPSKAIMFAGILFACAAVAMTWIHEPPILRDGDQAARRRPRDLPELP